MTTLVDAKVTGRELDTEVALKVMRWEFDDVGNVVTEHWPESDKLRWQSCYRLRVPEFSSDTPEGLWACRQMEERIKELGLKWEYADNLRRLLGISRSAVDCQLFAIAHASPEVRCRAALKI